VLDPPGLARPLLLARLVLDGHHEQRPIERLVRMVDDLEGGARDQPGAGAGALDALGLAPQPLEPGPGQPLPLGRIGEAARVLVRLRPGRSAALAHGGPQLQGGPLVVVVGHRGQAHLDLAHRLQPLDLLRGVVAPAIARPVGHLGVAGDGRAGARGVGQHQHVAPAVVLEEVGDPLLGEEPGHQLEVALVVLHAVGARRVAAGEGQAVGHLPLVQQLRHDLRRGERLEDPPAAPQRQLRELGHEAEPVARLAVRHAGQLDGPDDPVDVALRQARPRQREVRLGAHHVGQLDGPPVGQVQLDVEGERLRDRLTAGHRRHRQLGLREGAGPQLDGHPVGAGHCG